MIEYEWTDLVIKESYEASNFILILGNWVVLY